MRLTTLQKYWRIFWLFRRLRLMTIMEYRSDFFLWTFVSIMWTVFNFFFYGMIVNVNGSIGGWDRSEMYVLLGTFTMIDAFTWSFLYANMREYTGIIFDGQLSMQLVKPIDTQYLLSVQTNSYNNVVRFFIGLYVVIKSLTELGKMPSIFDVFVYILLTLNSLLFVYSLWFMMATLGFWLDKVDNVNEIVPHSRRLWQVPKEIYTGVLSTVFTVLLPLGLVGAIPSEVLVGKSTLNWAGYYVLFTAVLFFLNRRFFHFSLRKYAGVGN